MPDITLTPAEQEALRGVIAGLLQDQEESLTKGHPERGLWEIIQTAIEERKTGLGAETRQKLQALLKGGA